MQQRGGEIIGEGSYGCVFDPPLACEGPIQAIKKGSVGKITELNEANNEYEISLTLKEMPYSEEYFVLINNVCVPKARAKQNDKTVSKCKVIEGVKITSTIQLIMPFGGKPLIKLINTINSNDLHTIGQKLLEAGTLLLLAGVVHSDLHIANILIDSSGKLRLIDFGNAWMPSQLNETNFTSVINYFNAQNMQKTLEETIISAFIGDIDIDLAIAKMMDEKKVLELLNKLTGNTLESNFHILRKFMKSSLVFRERNWLFFYKIYWRKIDAWAIGTALLYTFINTLMINKELDPRSSLWQECISGLCEIDPGKRLDASEALELWAPDSKILALPEVQKMLKEQKEIRNQLIQKIGVS